MDTMTLATVLKWGLAALVLAVATHLAIGRELMSLTVPLVTGGIFYCIALAQAVRGKMRRDASRKRCRAQRG